MPSTMITSAPDFTHSLTSSGTRVAPILMKTGMRLSVTSRNSSILIARSSGPTQSGCRQADRWSMPAGSVRILATRSETLSPSSMPPPPGLAPWPMTISTASARRRSSGLKPYRDGRHW